MLTETLATEFLTDYVCKLNKAYNSVVLNGYYDQMFYNFNLQNGNRYSQFDYLFDEYLPNKYLFFSIFYKVKFVNAFTEDVERDVAICLPINAIKFLEIKMDILPNAPDIKKEFVKYMHKIFGEKYMQSLKRYVEKVKNQTLTQLNEKEKIAEQKIDYFNSFLDL